MFIGSPLESVKQSLLSRNQPFIAAPSEPTPPGAPKLSGVDLYSRFAFAGAVCCSVTHGALTPVDVVRCAINVHKLSSQVFVNCRSKPEFNWNQKNITGVCWPVSVQ
jgi:hypothetical protein